MSSAGNDSPTYHGPHIVYLQRTAPQFGFALRGSRSEGGKLISIGGVLYAPLQEVCAILKDGSASKAGIKVGDRILEVNGVSVEGSTNDEVLELARSSRECLILTVISEKPEEVERPDTAKEENADVVEDCSENPSQPITIPNYTLINHSDERYISFNIYMNGKKLCSRRYREFSTLNFNLRKEFKGFTFAKLPGKWPFQLSEQQLDARRRDLEHYLKKVCATDVIFESKTVQKFLEMSADVRVMHPNGDTSTIFVKKSANAAAVWDILVQHAKFTAYTQQYFYLFEKVTCDFERKVQQHEIPYQLYVNNVSTAPISSLCVHRWLFTVDKELSLPDDEQAIIFLYHHTVAQVIRGNIHPDPNRVYELIMRQDPEKASQYLALARTFPGYGDVIFPQCSSDGRVGSFVAAVRAKSFCLYACLEDVRTKSHKMKILELTWDKITCWESLPESKSFDFQYNSPNKQTQWVKLNTPHHAFLADCFDRIREERTWKVSTE